VIRTCWYNCSFSGCRGKSTHQNAAPKITGKKKKKKKKKYFV